MIHLPAEFLLSALPSRGRVHLHKRGYLLFVDDVLIVADGDGRDWDWIVPARALARLLQGQGRVILDPPGVYSVAPIGSARTLLGTL